MLNIFERKNNDNQTYIDCARWLLRYFEMGGFHIRDDKRYGYYVYIEKNDENAELCNGNLIAITEHGIHIKIYNGRIDKNGCHTFDGWKYFAKRDFTLENKDYKLSQMRFYIHINNIWSEIVKKKIAVADKKIDIEKDFENG